MSEGGLGLRVLEDRVEALETLASAVNPVHEGSNPTVCSVGFEV